MNSKVLYNKQNNAYLPAARNKGIMLAKGSWICFLDDDDYYLPNHLLVLNRCIIDNNFQEALNGRKYMLIILWASWCVPCRNEIPHLKDFNKSYQQNVSLVSLSIEEDYNRWKKAVIEEKMAWLNLSGLPKNKNQVAFTYDVKAVPTMILLDENGNIIQKNKNDLQKIIQAIEIYK